MMNLRWININGSSNCARIDGGIYQCSTQRSKGDDLHRNCLIRCSSFIAGPSLIQQAMVAHVKRKPTEQVIKRIVFMDPLSKCYHGFYQSAKLA